MKCTGICLPLFLNYDSLITLVLKFCVLIKYLPQFLAEFKNEWSHNFTPSIRLRGLWKDKYTFTFNSNRLVVTIAKNITLRVKLYRRWN